MKMFEELTHEEIIKLTDEDIERYILIDIAEAGIMPVVPPKECTLEQEGISKCIDVWKCNGVLFETEEDALAFAKLKVVNETYDYNIGYEYKYVDFQIDREVKKVSYYKQGDLIRLQGVIQKNKERKDEYTKQKEDYDKYMKETGSIRTNIYNTYHDAMDLERSVQKGVETFESYKTLAEGDNNIALRFLEKAYKENNPELYELILETVNKQEETV